MDIVGNHIVEDTTDFYDQWIGPIVVFILERRSIPEAGQRTGHCSCVVAFCDRHLVNFFNRSRVKVFFPVVLKVQIADLN
jgi:hypothetical protein